jgi:hypothetical protein
VNEPVAIVFFPESPGIPPAIREWQARNPDWRVPFDEIIVCPVCGIPVRAIVDTALLDRDEVRHAVRRYREEYLRAACSDHLWPPEEYWVLPTTRSR